RVALLDVTNGRRVLLEEMDATTAHLRVHRGAVYLHQGTSYVVTELDLQAGIALLKQAEPGYHTQPRELNEIQIIRSLRHQQFDSHLAFYGGVRVTSQVVGYTRKKPFSDDILDQTALDLPPQRFETMAVWWTVPSNWGGQIDQQGGNFAGGLHAVEHACIGMLPLLAMCDRFDLGGVSTIRHADTEGPLICVYDAYPGGVGLAERGFEVLRDWWQATLEMVATCPCDSGCPSCIHSPQCGNNNEPLDKRAAVAILRALLSQ
ncbi:MAG: DUF1998 domain-containing protein, partial [Anaerolineae bacterium]|nr:DUF1998 domain-containing protein [Anaerolineae bacterium]